MRFASLAAVSVAALALGIGAASAATFTGSFGVNYNTAENGLQIDVDPSSGVGSFDLELNQSITFDLFKLWTPEGSIQGDDKVAQPISVAFDLTAPAAGSATVTGTTNGHISWIPFWPGYASLAWDSPVMLNFGTTGQLEVTLSNTAYFQVGDGFGDLGAPFYTKEICTEVKQEKTKGKEKTKKECKSVDFFQGATVQATVKYLSADIPVNEPPAPVPLPAAGGLLLAGAGALAALRRRKG